MLLSQCFDGLFEAKLRNLYWIMYQVSSAWWCCSSISFPTIVFPILSVLLLFQSFVFAIFCFSLDLPAHRISPLFFFFSSKTSCTKPTLQAVLFLHLQPPPFPPCYWVMRVAPPFPSPSFLMSVLLCFPLTFSLPLSLSLSVCLSLSLCEHLWGEMGRGGAQLRCACWLACAMCQAPTNYDAHTHLHPSYTSPPYPKERSIGSGNA